MDEFKILSIEELDAEFVTRLRVKKAVSETKPESLIPEILKPENEVFSDSGDEAAIKNKFSVLDKYGDSESDRPDYKPLTEEEKKPRPIVPIGQISSSYSPDGPVTDIPENNVISEKDFEVEETNKKEKRGKGSIAGKILCVFMLILTVVVFLAGCLISIFLNNNGLDLNGICFNTQVETVKIGDDTIKEGDLIISTKTSGEEFKNSLNLPVALPVGGVENEGCVINYVYSVTLLIDDEVSIQTYHPETNEINAEKYADSETFGIVKFYIPLAGGILLFAINNAVLVCALFVLMAAFWCLILVLLEKNSKRNKIQ